MKYYCLTLREVPERTEHAKREAAKAGIELDFIYGFFGRTLEVVPRIPMHTDYFINRGITCIFLTWLMAWQMAYRDGHDEFVIFEDDLLLPDNFKERFAKIRADIPDTCDMVFLGNCCTEDKPKVHVAGDLYDIRYPMCLHALWFRRRAVEKLLQQQHPANTPIDIVMEWHWLKHVNVLTVLPELVGQGSNGRGIESAAHL